MITAPECSMHWYGGLSLVERIVHQRSTGACLQSPAARQRLARWKELSGLTDEMTFAQRLAADSISQAELLSVLGEMEYIPVDESMPPGWARDCIRAFTAAHTNAVVPEALLAVLQYLRQTGPEFVVFIEPLLRYAYSSLCEQIKNALPLPSGPVTALEPIVAGLCEGLANDLLACSYRMLVLELNIARLRGTLVGTTPSERFQSFVDRLAQAEAAMVLLKEYPVLIRHLMSTIAQWMAANLELLQRLCNDWEMLCSLFAPAQEPGFLDRLTCGLGDKHRGGRSVTIASFSSGWQVVYKPRSLAIDCHFQEFLAWLNEQGSSLPFRTIRLLDRGVYGWSEYVEARPCESRDSVRHFYWRQGAYLALLYLLNATDCHYENIIAAGEHPILIDLESLLHPRITSVHTSSAEGAAFQVLNNSVLGVGMLPNPMVSDKPAGGADLSGLGALAGQQLPYRVPQVSNQGTDEMHIVMQPSVLLTGHHTPLVDGAPAHAHSYVDEIIAGFTDVYKLLLKHREVLLSPSGPVMRFTNDVVRVIVRPTRFYGGLLHNSQHPDMLRDALHRDRLLDCLWQDVGQQPELLPLIRAERDDLWSGNVPIFTTQPGLVDLFTSRGERVPGVILEASMQTVVRRMQQLSSADLATQLWLIRVALMSQSSEQPTWPLYQRKKAEREADRQELLSAACAVGERLAALAIRGKHDVTWLGVELIGNTRWALVPAGMGLYSGIPGIALFLAYLGHITRQDRYEQLAQRSLHRLRCQLQRSDPALPGIGGFEGWGAIIYTFTQLGALWNDTSLYDQAEEIVDRLPALIGQDERNDLVHGAAGCIASLLCLNRVRPSARVLSVARQCGEHLLAQAQNMQAGVGWLVLGYARPLAGLSHGAAGIAWALMELAAVSGEQRFAHIAQAAMDYERSVFVAQKNNWPDLRGRSGDTDAELHKSAFMHAWCHGAPGIGLARLATLRHCSHPRIYEEIRVAIGTTLQEGFGANHSLCHGDMGNLELLLSASQIFHDAALRKQTYLLATMILQSIQRHGWLCGVPLALETPGLMTGLAGIGYGLLRLTAPDQVPVVLMLEAPRAVF